MSECDHWRGDLRGFFRFRHAVQSFQGATASESRWRPEPELITADPCGIVTLKDEVPWEVRSEFELGYSYEPSDMSWDVLEGEHKVIGEWRLRLRRPVAEARHPKGLRDLEGVKNLIFGGMSFKDDAPWQISYVWYPGESCRNGSVAHEPGYDEMLYRDGVGTGWQTPDATGQEWAEVIARRTGDAISHAVSRMSLGS